MKRLKTPLIAIFCMLILASCAADDTLEIKNAWLLPGIQGNTSAAYFTIVNPSTQTDSLLSVSSEIAAATEIHKSETDDTGVMSMHHQLSVEISAGEQVEFKPGGLHVMFVDLKQDLKIGDQVELTLNFKNAGQIQVPLTVQEPPQ